MLHIADCPLLDDLPSGMQRLTALDALTIAGCPILCQKCQPHSGEYWPMIAHIKRVSIGEPGVEEPSIREPEVEEPREGRVSLVSRTDLLPYLW
jgi:hypothetical protein